MAGSVCGPFEGASVCHSHPDGGRLVAQHYRLFLSVYVDPVDVIPGLGDGRIVSDVHCRAAAPPGALLAGAGRVAGIATFPSPAGRTVHFRVASFQGSGHASTDLTLRAHSDGSRPASLGAGQSVDASRPAVIIGQFLLVRLVRHPLRLWVLLLLLGQSPIDTPRPFSEHEPGIGHVPFQVNHVVHISGHAPGQHVIVIDGQRNPAGLPATAVPRNDGQFDDG